jgi:hypothetical protein
MLWMRREACCTTLCEQWSYPAVDLVSACPTCTQSCRAPAAQPPSEVLTTTKDCPRCLLLQVAAATFVANDAQPTLFTLPDSFTGLARIDWVRAAHSTTAACWLLTIVVQLPLDVAAMGTGLAVWQATSTSLQRRSGTALPRQGCPLEHEPHAVPYKRHRASCTQATLDPAAPSTKQQLVIDNLCLSVLPFQCPRQADGSLRVSC